ncbi:MAG TPA: oligoendopeptidase F [Bacillota bacterium]|nr:oligoendopeptidase F [Bacillota bacterium]
MEANKPKHLPKREEIPDQYKWDLAAIYPSLEAWEADFQVLKGLLAEMNQKAADFLNSAAHIYEVLQLKDRLGRVLDKLFVYARMHKDENNADSKYQALTDRIQSLATEAGGVVAFIVPALVQLPREQLERYLNEQPDLRLYSHFFAEIERQKQHVLSASEEKLLAESGEIADAASSIFGMLDNADLKFPEITDENGEKVELTKGRFSRFLESKDRRVRQEAFETLYSTYTQYRNTLGATLNASVRSDVFYAKARRFDSALQASLDNDNVPVAVYDRLIEVVHQFLPSLHRYLKLRKQLLNLPELHMYDLYAPLIPEYQRNVEYEEAKEIVLEALKPLGDEYCNQVAQGFANGWIDVCENAGKTSGAYAWGAYDTHPYVLLNYQGKIHDVFTLAHEIGHAMHSFYSNRTQPYIYAGYRIFVAEVASTVNEALLLDYLLAKSTDVKEQQYLINQWLEQFRTTLIRQTMFAEFEKMIHSEVEGGGALTADFFCERYFDLNKTYYGAETIIDEPIAMEWSRIPHFYNGFYVYKYATGYSAATALSQQILKEGAPARERYLEFLMSGDADYPLNVLRRAGVDMESPRPVEEALNVFDGLVTRMAELTGVKL